MIRIPNNDLGITPGVYKDDSQEAIDYRAHLDAERKANKTYIDKRMEEYGTAAEQLEFITENGLTAWQSKVAQIKGKYPKE